MEADSRETQCWWCEERPATSSEHKFKRWDLAREHGRGELAGPHQLVFYGTDETRYLRSTRSTPLKFRPSLCEACNSARSQPYDAAYDRFIDWILQHEEEILAGRIVNLEAALGSGWAADGLDILRYWAKHIGCRVVENDPDGFDRRLPPSLIPFLNGSSFPEKFSFELWIEPAWLRFCERDRDDSLWVRPMLYEQLYWPEAPGQAGITQSIWRYGWLTLGWAFGDGTTTHNPFSRPQMDLPIRAQASADLELMWGGLRFVDPSLSPVEAETRRDAITGGGPIDPQQTLQGSPIAEAFTGGMLDFEAAVRGREPNRRDYPEEATSLDQELWRAVLAVATALSVWGFSELNLAQVRTVSVPNQVSARDLRRATRELRRAARGRAGFEWMAADLAQTAGGRLLEAIRFGVKPQETTRAIDGQEALRNAAEFAGRSAAAAGLARDDLPGLWASVDAARARMARFE